MTPFIITSRRQFLTQTSLGLSALPFMPWSVFAEDAAQILPMGGAPAPLDAAWFPSGLHAFVWRNWSLVSLERMAATVSAKADDLASLGRSMGLEPPRGLSDEQRRRVYLTVIRRNWHLLPYDQILTLLD